MEQDLDLPLGWAGVGTASTCHTALLHSDKSTKAPSQGYQCSEAFSAVGLGHAIGF